jgi:hypothetical protein
LIGLIATLGVLGVTIGYLTIDSNSSDSSSHFRASQATVPTRTRPRKKGRRSSTRATVQKPIARSAPLRKELFTAADRASFGSLERALGGTSGLAASAVGLDRPVSELGTLHEGVAWSTIKVPIALAVEARSGGRPTASEQALLTRAITASDNAAAESLWSSLGPPNAAAAAVRSILAASGDASTSVETRVLRAGFTSFGQTHWSLAAQQHFIAGLPCLANSAPVLSLMQQVESDQRWGLGTLGTATQFKGGWGPDLNGRYLVRQMGIVRLANGRSLAVSIATIPANGSFATGTANLGEIARWLIAHVDASELRPVQCR